MRHPTGCAARPSPKGEAHICCYIEVARPQNISKVQVSKNPRDPWRLAVTGTIQAFSHRILEFPVELLGETEYLK